MAKAAATFNFNEIVVVSNDKTAQMKLKQDLTTTEFFVQNLEYSETPQYLRKALFPKSPALRFAGLMKAEKVKKEASAQEEEDDSEEADIPEKESA